MANPTAKRSLPLLHGDGADRAITDGSQTPAPTSGGEVAIWYISNLQRCNFTCSYCTSNQPNLQKDRLLPTWRHGVDVHERIVDWLTRQPFPFRLRMNSIGEPFASAPYLQSVARLTRAPQVSFVEILTNGSFRMEQFDRFADSADIGRLSMWMTFHHEFITPADLVAAAVHARTRGAFVVINTIVFPDNARAVGELVQRCKDNGVRIATGFGLNFNDAYPGRGRVPARDNPTREMLELGESSNVLGEFHDLGHAPAGQRCGAGSRYFFISSRGQVFPCYTYAGALPPTQLGSALDPDFRLSPRLQEYGTCAAPGICRCPEDYQNLEVIQQQFEWALPTFGMPVRLSKREGS